MRRCLLLLLVGCTGCSTAPVAGFLDTVRPSKARVRVDGLAQPTDPFFAEPRVPPASSSGPIDPPPPIPSSTPPLSVPGPVPPLSLPGPPPVDRPPNTPNT